MAIVVLAFHVYVSVRLNCTYSLLCRDKELASIAVRTGICHTDSIWFVMFQCRELILKLPAPDAFTSRAITKWITSLNHELPDYTVEDDVVVVTILSVSDEVLNGLGRGIGEEADCNIAVGSVNRGRSSCGGFLGFFLSLVGDVLGFLVLNVSFRLRDTSNGSA